jgi:rhodanese-related sulfurtransferase
MNTITDQKGQIDMEEYYKYIPLILIIGFIVVKKISSNKVKCMLPELLNNGGVVVDVRTKQEYQQAHDEMSINIPLDELQNRSSELNKNSPIILCCASGARSASALKMLNSLGFEKLHNIGPWRNAIIKKS